MVASRWPQRLPFLAAAIRRSISRPVRYSRVRTGELTVFGAARPPARFSTIFPQRWNRLGTIISPSVSIHAARYSASLSPRRHTQPLPARRTFFAPIERSARLVDHLRRSRPAASVDDLGTSPFRQRRRRGFAVVGAEAKPHATL